MKRWAYVVGAMVLACGVDVVARDGRRVTLDVKEVALGEVVKLLAAQGGPRLTVAPDAGETEITFAISAASRGATMQPSKPSRTSSCTPPTSVTTTGNPMAIASIVATPIASS